MGKQGSGIWTDERVRVLHTLGELSEPILAQLYEHAIDLASDYAIDSNKAQFYIAIIGHCVRELMNNISYYLGDNSLPGRNRSGAEDRAIKSLRKLVLSECSDATLLPPEGATQVPITASLAEALSFFREAAIEGERNAYKSASMGAIGRIEEDNPATALWKHARDSFAGYAHLSKGNGNLPERSELLHNLDILDNALMIRLGFFFDAKQRINDILERANRCSNGKYEAPIKDDLDAALSLLGDSGIRFVFYSGLTNPEWLLPLEERKAFERSIPLEGGVGYDSSWPEALFLRLIACEKPEDVTRIILRSSSNPHPTIRLSAIELSNRLPLKNAVEIADAAICWADEHYRDDGFFWIHDEVISLISRLMASDVASEQSKGKKLFQLCFKPNRNEGFLSNCRALIPDWSYSKSLSKLQNIIDSLPLKLRVALLCSFADALVPDGILSTYVAPSIAEAYKQHSNSMAEEILYQVVQAFLSAFAGNPDLAVEMAQKRAEKTLTFRCVLFTCQILLERAYNTQSEIPQSVNTLLHRILLSELILNAEFEAELYPLYAPSIRCGIVTPSEFVEHVECSCGAKAEAYRSKFSSLNLEDTKDPLRYARQWEHRLLTLVGCDALDETRMLHYQELSKEFSNCRYSLGGGGARTITGPNSPLSDEELFRMTPEELLSFLEAWHPSESDRNQLISHLGLGRHLSRRVNDNPFYFEGMAERLCELRPTYQTEILSGWNKVLSERRPVPLDDVLLLLAYASERSEKVTWQPEGDSFDDDCNYLNLRREAASLAVTLLDLPAVFSDGQRDGLLDSIIRLLKSDEPSGEYERKYGGSNSDPFTISLNTIRPIAIRALAKWIITNPKESRASEALAHLESFLPDRSLSEADAAAIGEALPPLMEVNMSWATKHRSALFGDGKANRYQQIVFTTILSLYYLSPQLLRYCSPAISSALAGKAEPYATGFRLDGADHIPLIGRQLYRAYAIGYLDWDDNLLTSLWEKVDANQAGAIIGRICSMVGDGTGVTEAIASRIGKLWDYHANVLAERKGAASLKGILHLLRSKLYSISWWGPRLLKELKINPGNNSLMLFEDEFLELSDEDPKLAMDVLRCIIENDRYPMASYYEKYGILILNKMKGRNDGLLSADAIDFMDLLGKIGCLDIDEKIDR